MEDPEEQIIYCKLNKGGLRVIYHALWLSYAQGCYFFGSNWGYYMSELISSYSREEFNPGFKNFQHDDDKKTRSEISEKLGCKSLLKLVLLFTF